MAMTPRMRHRRGSGADEPGWAGVPGVAGVAVAVRGSDMGFLRAVKGARWRGVETVRTRAGARVREREEQ
ncbi:hypothetical protein GCM10009774_06260 [Cellulomonas gelida]|uniref:Uncharacterized protein n=1 Tax=Cellulomonas gelida TaxID=1712 RepID=A0A4Y3KKP6_9CELL|nr:hypothetical protein CGE01nite_22520 [Cellulomonas gelida]GGL18670.1 hypothetical protein GCM10009774_06260 [Cellulomonas gelida]